MIKKTQKKKSLKSKETFNCQHEEYKSFLTTAGMISNHFTMMIPTDEVLKIFFNY